MLDPNPNPKPNPNPSLKQIDLHCRFKQNDLHSFYSLLKIYNFGNIVQFLKCILQVVDNAMFSQNVLLYFKNDPLSPSF